MTKVMIFGTFDLFHPGHEFVLNEALKRGDVTVIVARDENVKRIKGKTPTDNEETRKVTIEKKFPKANVILGDPDDFLTPLKTVKPDLILLGYDQRMPPGVELKELGVKIERLPPHKPERYKTSLKSKGNT